MNTIGERIRIVREARNLNQTDFATAIGIKQNTLSLIENRNKNTSDRVLNAICHVFGINMEWLRTGKGEMFQKNKAQALGRKFSFKELTVQMLEAFEQLTPEQQDAVLAYARQVVAAVTEPHV